MCYHVIGFPSPGPPDRLAETARPASLPAACLHGAGIWGLGAGVRGLCVGPVRGAGEPWAQQRRSPLPLADAAAKKPGRQEIRSEGLF